MNNPLEYSASATSAGTHAPGIRGPKCGVPVGKLVGHLGTNPGPGAT